GEEWAVGGKSALELLKEKLAKKELRAVDHGGVEYIPFRKAFYIEPRSIAALAPLEVAAIRDSLGIKLRGRGVPKPLETWDQTGLPSRLLQSLQERQFAAPFAIQRQALPIIMSGRDVIGIAKTGSGKTLAYLLPMFRQILDQPPLNDGDGPIGLILAPARELVTQIYHEARKFAKPLGLRVAAVYGGAQVSEQIADLKRRAEVVVATPGRLIDILTMNSGRVISLSRVTYVVLDEADRMFDMGFEPQITRILNTVRPDRQTVLFSATFPLHVEMLAKSALTNPIELVVGGRSTASADVTQLVEVHTESEKFPRLLQLLGHWYERGNVLIFVDTKEHCDQLYLDLMKFGYPAVSLHGGKDQTERDETIADFKSKVATIMVATSVAGRGLDVKDLVLVVNYSCPDHLEDYVHRVGRTGRAGRKGTAYTFITPEEGKYADDLIRALTDAKQSQRVTPELAALAAEHHRKVAAGEARKRASGFTRTKGFKFDATEMSATQASRDAHRRAYELQAGIK
ncbi:DEAD/DEAH box helicase, partial [archaeon]